ncbi:MAG: glycosyltransferase family 4 protein [Dysgonamonadaceae bacterium]|jgi:glycosyltransferase involved in cell wall biosynthesis|nr:glycosyltransferase family 4 protein [Dysgonamonadaceae bacterium]
MNLSNFIFNLKKRQNKKIRVGLLITEFFGGAGSGFGGYGMLARNYICKYIPNDKIKIDVLLSRGGRLHYFMHKKYKEDGINLYRLPRWKFATRMFLKHKNYDVYLSIELTFDWVLRTEPNPFKKLILWIQDPRPKYEWDEINTVKLFSEPCYYDQLIYDTVHRWNNAGRIRFISQGYFLNPKAIDLYRLPPDTSIQYLPNPVDIDYDFNVAEYEKKNMIIFLGRIESVKRGWLFCEIAKQMPEYDFVVLGQTHSSKEKRILQIMEPYKKIKNLHFAGHVDGAEKAQFLKDAKILINTSIHEALPVSFLEALSYGTVLVSNRNPEDLTSKFGIWTGDVWGDGFDKVGLYVDAVRKIMTDEKLRKRLAIDAVEYVKQVHNVSRFVKDLRNVIIDTVYE